MPKNELSDLARNNAKMVLRKRSYPPKAEKNVTRNTKRAPPPREIAYNEMTQLAIIKDVLACSVITNPYNNTKLLYSGITCEPMAFKTYVIVLHKPPKKGELVGPYLAGVTRPELVFTVLRRAWSLLHPEQQTDYSDWELYKWNVLYYGKSLAGKAVPWLELETQNQNFRFNGGSKSIPNTNIVTEAVYSKWKYAVSLNEILGKEVPTRLVDELNEIVKSTRDLLEDEDFIKEVELSKKVNTAEATVEELSDDENSEENHPKKKNK